MKRVSNLGRRSVQELVAVVLAAVLSFAFAAFPAGQKKKPPARPLDLNTATVEQLEQLPGIGPVTAKAIVRFREKSGPFQRVDDLLAIHRISKSRLDKLRPYVTVAAPAKKRVRSAEGPRLSVRLELFPENVVAQTCCARNRRASRPLVPCVCRRLLRSPSAREPHFGSLREAAT